MWQNKGALVSSSIVLKAGDLQATFLPESGMRCVNFMYREQALLEEGLVVGPHFGKRKMKSLKDPYPYGLGRYGNWEANASASSFRAHINGDMTWQNEPLKALQNQNFKMTFEGDITPTELVLTLSVISDSDSIVGIEYFFPYAHANRFIETSAKREIYIEGKESTLPERWDYSPNGKLKVPTSEDYAFSFRPYPNPTQGEVIIDDLLKVKYESISEESSWILRNHPQEKIFSLGAVSSQNPWKPNLTVSSITIKMSVS